MQSLSKISVWLCFYICLGASSLFAQWRIQDIELKPGWNAVRLEISPQPFECEKIFAGLQIESVWKWNKRFTSTEFNIDPSTMLPDDPHWLVWFPPDHPTAFLTRLYNMSALPPILRPLGGYFKIESVYPIEMPLHLSLLACATWNPTP